MKNDIRIKISISSIFKILTYIYVVLLPIGTGLAGIIGSISLVNYFAAGIILCGIFHIVSGHYSTVNKAIIPTLMYFSYTILSYLWTTNQGLTWYVMTNMVNGLLFLFLNLYHWDFDELKRFDVCFIISQLIVYAVVIRNISTLFVYRLNITVISTIGIGDFAVGLCMLIAFWMDYAARGEKLVLRIVSYLAALSNLAIILMAGSRGGLAMFLAMAIVWVLLGNYSRRTKAVIILLALFVYFFTMNELVQLLPAVIRNRMTMQAVMDSNGSGRFNIWRLAFRHFTDSNLGRMLFGFGFNSFLHEISYGSNGGYHDLMAHNAIVQTMIEGGLCGLILLLRMGFTQIRDAWKRRDNLMLVALAGLFVAGLSNDMQVTRIWGFILTFNYIRGIAFNRYSEEIRFNRWD